MDLFLSFFSVPSTEYVFDIISNFCVVDVVDCCEFVRPGCGEEVKESDRSCSIYQPIYMDFG